MAKILVIAGGKRASEGMVLALEEAGFDVIKATDIAQGLVQLAQSQPYLVILNDTPPVTNAVEFCFQARQMSQVPIIVIGNGRGKLTSVRFLEMGADAYMTKPVNPVLLVARVRSLLRRALGLRRLPILRKKA